MKVLDKIRRELQEEKQTTLMDFYINQLHRCQNYLVKRGMANREDAKDIYADAFLIFRKNIITDKLKPNSNLKSYLLGICMNLARSKYRQKQNKNSRVAEVRSLLYETNPKNTRKESEEVLNLCIKALDSIEPKGRRILELFYFEKYSMSEIADELGYTSSDAAKTAKYRVYKKWILEANKLRTQYFESI